MMTSLEPPSWSDYLISGLSECGHAARQSMGPRWDDEIEFLPTPYLSATDWSGTLAYLRAVRRWLH